MKVCQADELRERFERIFWSDELGTYVLPLDNGKRPCRVRLSNAGQCLFAGIAEHSRAARVARGQFSTDSFSGWGIRTIATGEAR
jgi:glycogen debranching enzyme